MVYSQLNCSSPMYTHIGIALVVGLFTSIYSVPTSVLLLSHCCTKFVLLLASIFGVLTSVLLLTSIYIYCFSLPFFGIHPLCFFHRYCSQYPLYCSSLPFFVYSHLYCFCCCYTPLYYHLLPLFWVLIQPFQHTISSI